MKRKSMAEIRAEERLQGFNQALRVLENAWRKEVRLTPHGPRGGEALWTILEQLLARQGLLHDDVLALMFERDGGRFFPRLRYRVQLADKRRGFYVSVDDVTDEGKRKVYLDDGTVVQVPADSVEVLS